MEQLIVNGGHVTTRCFEWVPLLERNDQDDLIQIAQRFAQIDLQLLEARRMLLRIASRLFQRSENAAQVPTELFEGTLRGGHIPGFGFRAHFREQSISKLPEILGAVHGVVVRPELFAQHAEAGLREGARGRAR